MAGTIKANVLTSPNGLGGLTLDATSQRTNVYFNGWTLQQDGGILYPLNRTKVTYIPTGAQQTFVVPSGVTYIFVKLWGAGGGGGSCGGWTNGSRGGGGGHSYGFIPVTPGETLYLVVGIAGQTNYSGSTTNLYGGGGGFLNNTDNRYAGSGGGYCGIFRSSVSQANALLIAGAGGGGGSSRFLDGNWGGAGGGLSGQQGNSPYDARSSYGGGPGTQSAGGTSLGTAGGALYGGYCNTNAYGGGGGGGFYGGGGGCYVEANTMAGGGGGSGFIGPTVLLGATFTGCQHIPAHSDDNDLSKSTDSYNGWNKYGWGGDIVVSSSQYTSTGGGGSYCVIYY